MIRVVIIDDESDARFLLADQLKRNFGDRIEVVAEADDVKTGIEIIEKVNPELVFLDIRMKTGTGFDLLKHFDRPEFEVVFVTAYDQYAVEAFRFSAFAYLLKPIKSDDLAEVISKYEESLDRTKGSDPRLKVLVENYGDDGMVHKLVVSNVDGFRVVNLQDVLRLEGDGNYTHLIVEDEGKITSSKTLGEYEKMLTDHGFFRVHQSSIVNLRHVKAYRKGDGGEVETTDGHLVKVSRYRKAEFLQRFK